MTTEDITAGGEGGIDPTNKQCLVMEKVFSLVKCKLDPISAESPHSGAIKRQSSVIAGQRGKF